VINSVLGILVYNLPIFWISLIVLSFNTNEGDDKIQEMQLRPWIYRDPIYDKVDDYVIKDDPDLKPKQKCIRVPITDTTVYD
jgi:hypothetical protein